MKRRLAALLSLCLLLSLAGCGSVFEKEYVSVTDYELPVQEQPAVTEKITVRNAAGLRSALRSIVYAGAEEGTIVFDQSYDGSSREDLTGAISQMRTQDALFAYCVQQLDYEYSTIVSHGEAKLHVRYVDSASAVDQIQKLTYATGLEEILRSAMEENLPRIVILINISSYSTLQMKQLVADTYHAYPLCAVGEPETDVYMYSGSGRQRLYEIDLDYGLPEDEIIRRKAQLVNLDVPSNTGAEGQDAAHAALLACSYLAEHCELTEEPGFSSLYDALILGKADSEGLALSYVELCRQLGIECQMISGQLAWNEHFWNAVTIDGQRYHVDVAACIQEGLERGFLHSDAEFWSDYLYRWNTAAYAVCLGELRYSDLLEKPEAEAEPADETTEPTTEPTAELTAEPTTEPTAEPTAEPTIEPITEPTAEPTEEPTAEPTPEEPAETP